MKRMVARAGRGRRVPANPGGGAEVTRYPEVQLNLNVRGIASSATVAINERSNHLRAEGRRIYKLGLGQSPFPVPRPVVEELRNNAQQKDYLPVRGLAALREAVAEFHRRYNGIGCSAEDVLVGPGSKELMFLLQLVYYGDLLIPTPAWVSYAPQAHILGRTIRWLHTRMEDGYRLTPEALGAYCVPDPERPRILVLNYPSNPTGGSYSPEELEELAQVARRHRIVVLSDEIYARLHHHDRHVSIAGYYPEGTIVSSGLSKWCAAGGWRLGTFVFPASMHWLLDAMAAVASETYTSTSAPIQYAAVRAFRGGLRMERYLGNVRRVLRALGTWCAGSLEKAGARLVKPEGAFYVFPEFGSYRDELAARGIRNSRDMCEALLQETGVAILPGCDFGRPPEELSARLACVDFDGARALAAVEHIPAGIELDEEFLRLYCRPVVEAIRRLVSWLQDGGAVGRNGRA